MRPVVLRSNFTDYYDQYFDDATAVAPLVFNRFTDQGMNRREILAFLERNGFTVPRHGNVRDVDTWAPHLRDNQYVVVYLDEKSHRGENKLLLTLGEALNKHPDCLAAEFLGTDSHSGQAIRHVQVGSKYFRIALASDDWRAGGAHVKAEIINHGNSLQTKLMYPLWAIDFVPVPHRGNQILYAVDFSAAPRVGEYGMDAILDAQTAAFEIKQMVNSL